MTKTVTRLGLVGVLLVLAAVAWTALVRWRDARGFGATHRVETVQGTHYVVRLREVTIGRTATGPLVLVALRLENPNPEPLALERQWFVLVDGDKDYYLPQTTESQPATIRIPARGQVDNELLVYAVSEDAFQGVLGLQIGHYYWALLKNVAPYAVPLAADEYRTFRRREW